MKFESDGCIHKVKVRDNSIEITAVSGYNIDVDMLCSLQDSGKGYYVTFPSYSYVNPDHVFNLDYSELEYLYYAYKALKKKGKVCV